MKNIYRIIFLLILNSAFSILNSFSQTAPGIEWQNTIGGSSADWPYSIQQTSDGGYIIGGTSDSPTSGDKNENSLNMDYWVVKLDSIGGIQWQNTIGGNNDDQLYSVQQTKDGGYILGGYSDSDISGDKTENTVGNTGYTDYWVIKLDSLGFIQWQNTIGGNDFEGLLSIGNTFDGGYILAGQSRSNISGDKTEDRIGGPSGDYWIVKLDSIGNIQWQNTIGGTLYETAFVAIQTNEGGYFIAGQSNSDSTGDKSENNMGSPNTEDYWVLKLDSTGNILWQNTIGGNLNDRLYTAAHTNDGGFILGGHSWSNISGDKTEGHLGIGGDYWVVKIDSVGNIQWQNTIGGNLLDALNSLQQTPDSGYVLGGLSHSDISFDKTEGHIGGGDYWILKIDASGNIQWQNTIGGTHSEGMSVLDLTSDGGYILGGASFSNISGDKTENNWNPFQSSPDYWIIKLGPDTITGISQFSQLPNYPITISPNPLTTQSKLTFKNPTKEKFLFTLYDITGRVTESVSTTNNEIILTKGSKPAGVYLFNLMNTESSQIINGKIIITN